MMRRVRSNKWTSAVRWALPAVVVAAVSGCPPTAVVQETTVVHRKPEHPEAERRFDEGMQAWNQGDYGRCADLFGRFVADYPGDPAVDEARLYTGRCAVEHGDYARGLAWLDPLRTHEDKAVAMYAAAGVAIAQFHRGRCDVAVGVARSLVDAFADQQVARALRDVLWRCAASQGDVVLLARAVDGLDADAPSSAEARQALEEALARCVDAAVLQEAAAALPEKRAVWARVVARLARLAYDAGDFAKAAEYLSEVEESGAANARAVADVRAALDAVVTVDMTAVGLLAPVTGPLRAIGKEVLNGAMLAAGRSALSVVVRDTGGETPVADLVAELVMQEHVAAIVGPVDVRLAPQAVRAAHRFGVPLVLLTADGAPVADSPYAFRRFTSVAQELRSLFAAVQWTAQSRLVVLAPASPLGALVERETEKIAHRPPDTVVRFPLDTVDFSSVATQVAQARPDVLVLALTPNQLALAAPALAAADVWPAGAPSGAADPVARPEYLVLSMGDAPSVMERSGKYVAGARVVRPFHPRSGAAARFARRYVDRYKMQPTYFAAFAYDAVAILGRRVEEGAANRVELRRYVAQTTQDDVVVPYRGFDPSGEPMGALPVVTLGAGDARVP